MSARQRIARSLNYRSVSGAIGVAEPKFTTGWLSETGTRISDDVLVDARRPGLAAGARHLGGREAALRSGAEVVGPVLEPGFGGA